MKKNAKSSLTWRQICIKIQKLDNSQRNIDSKYNGESIVHPCLLNQDCLVHIFKFLPITDKFRVERVCKQWYEASQLSWKTLKILSFSANSWGLKYFGDQVTVNIIKKVLQRCGNKITHINMQKNSDIIKDVYSLAFLPRLCPNLQHVNLSYFNVTDRLLRELSVHCQSITTLRLAKNIYRCKENILGNLFSSLRNLKCLKLKFSSLKGLCFQYLNAECIEEIHLNHCRDIDWSLMCEIFKKFTKLHTLVLNHFMGSSENRYLLICLNELNIKNLVIVDYYDLGINNDFLLGLKNVYKNLKYLNISYNENITNKGLTTIALFANLEELVINDLKSISSIQMLSSMSNLKKLSCVENKIPEKDIIKFLCRVARIEFLNLTKCYFRDPKNFPHHIVETMKQHYNNITIKLKFTKVKVCHLPLDSTPVTFIL